MSNAALETAIEAAWEGREHDQPLHHRRTARGHRRYLKCSGQWQTPRRRAACGRQLACQPMGQEGGASGISH